MGSISGFKEYVDKNHPACPLCGGATEKKHMVGYFGTDPYHTQYSIQECVNCGAQHDEDGKILRDSN